MFLQFQSQRGLPRVLPTIVHLCLYLLFLLGAQNVSAASMAYAAIKWVHGILPLLRKPLDADICRKMVEAEKRRRTSLMMKKEPVSVELFKDIVRKYGHEDVTLKDLRLATMCVLSFAGLFRAKELLNIRVHAEEVGQQAAKHHGH